jgi:hypothetical protein
VLLIKDLVEINLRIYKVIIEVWSLIMGQRLLLGLFLAVEQKVDLDHHWFEVQE